jgi:hypothetical protein
LLLAISTSRFLFMIKLDPSLKFDSESFDFQIAKSAIKLMFLGF